MRIFLRVIAVLIGIETAQTTLLLWRVARLGGFGELARTGAFGLITMLGWVLTLAVGPSAVVQLWRLTERGPRALLFLASFALCYYWTGLLFFRGTGAETAQIAVPIVGNLLLSVLLVSAPTRRICQERESRTKLAQPLASAE